MGLGLLFIIIAIFVIKAGWTNVLEKLKWVVNRLGAAYQAIKSRIITIFSAESEALIIQGGQTQKVKVTDEAKIEVSNPFQSLIKRPVIRRKVKFADDMASRRVIINLYIVFVLKQISRGYKYLRSRTARETGSDLLAQEYLSGGDGAGTLLEQYEKARYAEVFAIDGDTLEECKKWK